MFQIDKNENEKQQHVQYIINKYLSIVIYSFSVTSVNKITSLDITVIYVLLILDAVLQSMSWNSIEKKTWQNSSHQT